MDRVKSGATVVFIMDLLLAVGWAVCAVTILSVGCLEPNVIYVQLFLLAHFIVQTVSLADIIGEVRTVEWEEKDLERRHQPHKPFMTPITWGLASSLALAGDVFLIAFDAQHFSTLDAEDTCRGVAIFQLVVEGASILTAVISLICFVTAAYFINQHRAARDLRYLEPVIGSTATLRGNRWSTLSRV